MFQEVVGTAVNRALGHNVVTLAGESRDGVGKGCCARCNGEACDTAFESGDTLFKDILCGVGEAAVNVAGILQVETVGSMLCAMEHVRGGLVDRNRTGIGCGVCGFLANVELKSFKVELVLCSHC